jgi:hypothetical protein
MIHQLDFCFSFVNGGKKGWTEEISIQRDKVFGWFSCCNSILHKSCQSTEVFDLIDVVHSEDQNS